MTQLPRVVASTPLRARPGALPGIHQDALNTPNGGFLAAERGFFPSALGVPAVAGSPVYSRLGRRLEHGLIDTRPPSRQSTN